MFFSFSDEEAVKLINMESLVQAQKSKKWQEDHIDSSEILLQIFDSVHGSGTDCIAYTVHLMPQQKWYRQSSALLVSV